MEKERFTIGRVKDGWEKRSEWKRWDFLRLVRNRRGKRRNGWREERYE